MFTRDASGDSHAVDNGGLGFLVGESVGIDLVKPAKSLPYISSHW